jgi:DNA-binding NtrC family response regulator
MLVVDDELGPRESLSMVFGHDFEVIHAASGLEGMARARARTPTVVTTNIRMPGINGIEFLAQFKREFPQVPVIILTACETIETARQALRLGASDYHTKPFDLHMPVASS